MCDTLTNSCGANQAAKDLCAQAESAADGATAKTGAQADAFNNVFGIQTVCFLAVIYSTCLIIQSIQDFASVTVIDDQGKVVSGGTSSSAPPANAAPATTAAATAAAAAPTETAASVAAGNSSGIGNFGKCSVPQIEFATGFDGRKETSFQPVDKSTSRN